MSQGGCGSQGGNAVAGPAAGAFAPLPVCARPSEDAREVAQGWVEHLSWARSCLGSSSVLPSRADSRTKLGWVALCIPWQRRPCPTHTSYPFPQRWNFPVLLWVGMSAARPCPPGPGLGELPLVHWSCLADQRSLWTATMLSIT